MPTAFDRLVDVLRALDAESVDYVLFGGQAVNLHGIPRFTEDIDLFVKPSAENVERLRRALKRIWSDPEVEAIRAEDLGGEYAVVRYGTPHGFAIDLVARIGEAFSFDEIESERLNLQGVPVRIATPRMLYRMKKDTVSPVDHSDAADLCAKFGFDGDD